MAEGDPRFFQMSHQDLLNAIMQEYSVNRPAKDAEDAADITIKAQILAGNVALLEHNQWYLLRQAFGRTADMPYLILLAEMHGIIWDAGTRASGWIKLARADNAAMDYTINAGSVFLSEPDTDGKMKKVSLLYDVVLKSGQSFCWGWCEVVELQAETLETYAIVGHGGTEITVGEQLIGSGEAGNIVDSEITRFDAAPPAGIETVENLSAGYSKSVSHLSTTTFTIVTNTNDQIKVNIDATAVKQITLVAAVGADGSEIAEDIQAKLRAQGGAFATAYCRYNVTEDDYQFVILSGTSGAASSVIMTAGDHDARATLGYEDPEEATGGYGFTGGLDPQTREELRGEFLDAVRNPGYGNAAFYRRLARQISGVLDAKIVGVSGGVYIYPISTDGSDFTAGELQEITDYIEKYCPVNIVGSVIVVNPVKVQLYARATIVLEDGFTLAGIEDNIQDAMNAYVSSVDIGNSDEVPPPTVRVNKLYEAILGIAGVLDASALKLDTANPPVATTNYVVPDNEVAQLQTTHITLST